MYAFGKVHAVGPEDGGAVCHGKSASKTRREYGLHRRHVHPVRGTARRINNPDVLSCNPYRSPTHCGATHSIDILSARAPNSCTPPTSHATPPTTQTRPFARPFRHGTYVPDIAHPCQTCASLHDMRTRARHGTPPHLTRPSRTIEAPTSTTAPNTAIAHRADAPVEVKELHPEIEQVASLAALFVFRKRKVMNELLIHASAF